MGFKKLSHSHARSNSRKTIADEKRLRNYTQQWSQRTYREKMKKADKHEEEQFCQHDMMTWAHMDNKGKMQ